MPRKRIVPVCFSVIAYTKGWSARTGGGPASTTVTVTTTAVAAAAWVPLSETWIHVLWMTWEMEVLVVGYIFAKFALLLNAIPMPMLVNCGDRLSMVYE